MSGERRALIIANGEYDNPGLSALRSPAADAEALAEVLADRTISEFDVQVVRDETAHVIAGRVEDLFADSAPDDVLLVHFSCHGLKSESGELFFAARNTRPERLASTAVPADFVQRCMRMSRSRSIVLLLDCCYGGAFSQGVAVRATGEANVLDAFPAGGFGGRGRAVITASNSIEYAFEGDHLADDHVRPSVFTSALVDGLRTGDADRDEDGWVALGELYDYLFDSVRERNPNQTPSRDIEMQGELYLARSRRRRIKPSPVPADLRAASEDQNMFTRLGAVTELQRRLASDNLSVAIGAHEVLTTMAQTDIRHVAEAADLARRDARVRAESEVVRFGEVVRGSRPVARIRLEGPPIARACRFASSHSWLRVTEDGDGAEIVLDQAEFGAFEARVTVTGPTGEVVVRVEGQVVQEPEPVPEPRPVHTPAPTPEPSRNPDPPVLPKPEPARPKLDPFAVAAGLLAFTAAVYLVVIAFALSSSVEDFFEDGGWTVLPLVLFAIGAGIAMFSPKTRRMAGPGTLCGLTLLSAIPSGPVLLVLADGCLVAAAVCALVSVRRDRSFRLGLGKPRGALAGAAIASALLGALGLVMEAVEITGYSSSRADEGAIYVMVSIILLVGTMLGVLLRPAAFGIAFLGGVAGGGIVMVCMLFYAMPSSSSVTGAGWGIALSMVLALAVVTGFAARKENG
ncbi:Caspase domain-containing protein [Amycolatopsis lurida]|uniref:Caspase n=1 Tax=Amycolatopsis lurida NRRL 2430 TaxID=1460371 RepID=A0A2P2FJC6_AMYLU|nr:caspase family protein [Amycolatopsis lurida]KFU76830.1 caspase [Amycolatopsis lurida NRRL 2430]SEE35726.1 Caspase domain-containing protein [Amycolatopsis lurida]